MRTPLIAANWKLNKGCDQARALAQELADQLTQTQGVEIVIAPIFTALKSVSEVIGSSPIALAAQNCYPVETGAYTGEISPLMLKDAGCSWVILGHSERRQLLGESNQLINLKVRKALEDGLNVILCVGETLAERDSGEMFEILTCQIKEGLNGVAKDSMNHLVIAYEPVWAIGTGKTATVEQAQETHSFVRGLLLGCYDQDVASATRILYGGSVKPGNIDGLMAQDDIDGALVGGASLIATDFCRIVGFETGQKKPAHRTGIPTSL